MSVKLIGLSELHLALATIALLISFKGNPYEFNQRIMAFYACAKKILDVTHFIFHVYPWRPHCSCRRIGHCTIHLHTLLIS